MTTRPSARPPWWRDFFDDTFFQLHDPLFTEAGSRREVAGFLDLLGLAAGARVLDAPCGWGRHTLLLPVAGVDAFGIDLSPTLLQRAVAGAHEQGPPARFAVADLRALPFPDRTFDAVINVFTSLGLFLRDDEDLRALQEAHRVLRPGAKFLLETMHRDDIVAAYGARDRWTLPNGTEVRVRRRFDPVSGISYERLRWRRGGQSGEKRHALRLRTATEIDGLLEAAGFEEREYYGGLDGRRFTHESPHLVVVGRRPLGGAGSC